MICIAFLSNRNVIKISLTTGWKMDLKRKNADQALVLAPKRQKNELTTYKGSASGAVIEAVSVFSEITEMSFI